MKKQYYKPQMKVVKIRTMRMLIGSNGDTSGPNAHDRMSEEAQFAPEFNDFE